MRLKIDPKIVAAMEPAKATVLEEALNELANERLEPEARWRVLQMEYCLETAPEKWKLEDP